MRPHTSALVASVLAFSTILGIGSFAGCGRGGSAGASGTPATTAAKPTAADVDEAKKTYQTICFTCHGMEGRGDGPGAGALDPRPRDLSSPEWQRSVTDEHIRNVITMGGAAVGKSPMMPAQPQLKGTPGVLEALVAYVRGLEQKN
ncbi:MAG TPA: cytochrome c [Planctomycetota bacterium]|nr:cytochrome c [Planctomycetota bacterium]